jgi:hypothetical protein
MSGSGLRRSVSRRVDGERALDPCPRPSVLRSHWLSRQAGNSVPGPGRCARIPSNKMHQLVLVRGWCKQVSAPLYRPYHNAGESVNGSCGAGGNVAAPFLVGWHAYSARRAYDLIMIKALGIVLGPQVNPLDIQYHRGAC